MTEWGAPRYQGGPWAPGLKSGNGHTKGRSEEALPIEISTKQHGAFAFFIFLAQNAQLPIEPR